MAGCWWRCWLFQPPGRKAIRGDIATAGHRTSEDIFAALREWAAGEQPADGFPGPISDLQETDNEHLSIIQGVYKDLQAHPHRAKRIGREALEQINGGT
jgi:hypothetical protein